VEVSLGVETFNNKPREREEDTRSTREGWKHLTVVDWQESGPKNDLFANFFSHTPSLVAPLSFQLSSFGLGALYLPRYAELLFLLSCRSHQVE